MLRQLRGQISYASVTATLALILALGSSSFAAPARDAASKLFSGKQIKNNSIASTDIKNNSVASGDVKNGSLLSKDFKRGQLPAGPTGPTGPAGPAGAAGGNPRLSHRTTTFNAPANEVDFATATCPAGKYATGGTARVDGAGQINYDQADGTGNSWSANYSIGPGDDADVVVQVICAPGPLPEGLIP